MYLVEAFLNICANLCLFNNLVYGWENVSNELVNSNYRSIYFQYVDVLWALILFRI